MSRAIHRAAALAALLILSGCADRPTPIEPHAGGAMPSNFEVGLPDNSPARLRHERLARRLALALRDESFRATVYRALSKSTEREGKVHLQRFLGAAQSPGRRRMAELSGDAESLVDADLDGSAPIEIYLPVPAHRTSWKGDSHLLVATALTDRERPVAFDVEGRRQLLDADRPPEIPVLALGRAEQPFHEPVLAASTCFTACDEDPVSGGDSGSGTTGGSSLSSSPGLYMTYASFSQTFEGWLKGDPEFEVHILGQDGSSSGLKSYQCAGAEAGGPYAYDQNGKQWSGNVLLFSQAQLDAYKAAHPNQGVRVFLIEDDDGACQIKMDSARVAKLFQQLLATYGSLTSGQDSLFSVKTFTKAVSLLNVFKSFWSVITTQDDLVGNAIEDVVAREYFPSANWIVKGENTITNGAIRLEMR